MLNMKLGIRVLAPLLSGSGLMLAIASCSSTVAAPPGPPAELQAVSSQHLTGMVGAQIEVAPRARVVDGKGKPVPGTMVTWTLSCEPGVQCAAGSRVSPEQVLTDEKGLATTTLTLGTRSGAAVLVARTLTTAGSVDARFVVTAVPGPPARITLSPDSMRMLTGEQRTVQATATDAYGNTIAGSVNYQWQSSDPAVAVVDSSGVVKAVAPGVTDVIASSNAARQSARVRVSAPLPPGTLPATINECETNTAKVCGVWTLNGNVYHARWSQGSEAIISAEHFSRDSVVFQREDQSGTSAGMRARYSGIPQGNAVTDGTVTWTVDGSTFSGRWSATW
jgi:hypothetical protein